MTNEHGMKKKRALLKYDDAPPSPSGLEVSVYLADAVDAEIERLTREREEYKIWWERDSTALGKALNEVNSLRAGKEQFRAAIEQLHAAVKTAQELAARRLMEIERLKARINGYADTNVKLRAELATHGANPFSALGSNNERQVAGSTHEPSEQPQYRKWPGEPPHCMSCSCGMTDEQKRTVPEADYLRVHKELMDLKYPQQGASRDASPGSNDWADAKGGLPDNKL